MARVCEFQDRFTLPKKIHLDMFDLQVGMLKQKLGSETLAQERLSLMRQLVPFFNLVDSTTKTPWVAFQSFFSIGVFPKIYSGTLKSWILIGFSIIFTIHFGGFPLFLETPICIHEPFFFGEDCSPLVGNARFMSATSARPRRVGR